MRGRLLVGLSSVALALVAAAAVEVQWLSDPRTMDGPVRATVALGAIPAAVITDADRVPALRATILARPLFEASRRPADGNSNGPSGVGASLPRLAGIVVGPAGRAVIFGAPSGGRALVGVEGEKVGGYLIQSIGMDQVVVVGGEGSRILHPTFDANASPITRVSAPPPVTSPPASDQPSRNAVPGLTGRPPGLAAPDGEPEVGTNASSNAASGLTTAEHGLNHTRIR